MSRKTVIVIAASCMTCAVIGLTIFFNISQVDNSMADTRNVPASIYNVVDEEPVLVKSLPAPILVQTPLLGPNTQIVRSTKTVQAIAAEHVN